MAKFSDIVKGTRAFSEPATIEIAPDVSIIVRFRPLAPFESSGVLASARADAKASGVDDPEAGEPIYEAARAVHTIALGLIDTESDSAYFDGGPDQIKTSRLLTTDVVSYLFELWQHWSESVSLQKAMLDETSFGRIMEEAAVGNARPFFGLRPGAQWNFTRTLASRHLSLLRSKSQFSSGLPETTNP